MSTKRIIRRAPSRDDLTAGTWLPITSDGRLTARIACPDCGSTGTLADHEIDDDGRVTPSVQCMAEDCGYHEVGVVLEGWTP